MYGIYLALVRHKDHVLFALSLFLSSFLLLNNSNPRMGIIRGKAAEMVSFVSSPLTWVKSLMFLEKKINFFGKKTYPCLSR